MKTSLSDDLHWDHVRPIAAGGPDMLANLRPTHGKCNRQKGAKWLGVGEIECA